MVPFVQMLNAFSSSSPCLEDANKLVNTVQKGLVNDKIPACIAAAAARGTGEGSGPSPLLQRASGPTNCVNGNNIDNLNVGAHQNSHGTKRVREESPEIVEVPTGSAHVSFESNVDLELSTHAHGQAAMGASPGDDEPSENLFATSDEDNGSVV